MTAPRSMLRAELVQPGQVELREVPVPDAGPGELLIRVQAALTCGTDLKLYRRGHPKLPLPTAFGHEFAGRVAQAGEGVTQFREGDDVACVPTAPCGCCALCLRGRENLCHDAIGRIVLGAFAEYVLLPGHIVSNSVFVRPPGLTAEVAAVLEPLACVVHGAERVRLGQAARVVLLGDGPIALLFAQLARLQGAGSVLVAGHHDIRLRTATRLGAETLRLDPAALDGEASDLMAGADVVIECVGTPQLWEFAQTLAAPGGEVLLYGGCAASTRAQFDTFRLHYEEVDLKGAFHYTRANVRRAFELLSEGRIAAAPLITHQRSLEQLPDALELALRRQAIKVAVRP